MEHFTVVNGDDLAGEEDDDSIGGDSSNNNINNGDINVDPNGGNNRKEFNKFKTLSKS